MQSSYFLCKEMLSTLEEGKKSADCHLKVSVQNQCSVIGFGNNSLSTVSLVLFASEKLLLFVVVVIFCFFVSHILALQPWLASDL